MSARYVAIHGHFYQPPRENPWLERIEIQASAHPFHDWNERIQHECYRPNRSARVLDADGFVRRFENNYARMSFNFGPTLLSWMERADPVTYRQIVEADRQSAARFSGHGSAMAQGYNHAILPLLSRRDKLTQVRWGIGDFVHRFGRRPEGMWLPEAAVDLETLEVLAEEGLAFTVLAPRQARAVRRLGSSAWQSVEGGRVDPKEPYLARLASGRSIALFFYDGPISQAVAFERLLDSGERLADRLLGGFDAGRAGPQLVHIATDGETYGHHHRHGEMALAFATDVLLARGVVVTNYGEHLARFPPTQEVEIVENSSWSCYHGVERWRSDCGCVTGDSAPGWTQAWRAPLRAAFDALGAELSAFYERRGEALFADPWAARDGYVEVLCDRGATDDFLARHRRAGARPGFEVEALSLLEVARNAQLMFTSCGWFFDELSRIETAQVLHYAGRAVQLAESIEAGGFEARLVERLAAARSNLPAHGDGAQLYERLVRPAQLDLRRVAAHHAVSSLFLDPAVATPRTFRIEELQRRARSSGRTQVVVGEVQVSSVLTREVARLSYGVLHFGDHNLSGGVRAFDREADHQVAAEELLAAFDGGRVARCLRKLDELFPEHGFALDALFQEEQRQVVGELLGEGVRDATVLGEQLLRAHGSLVSYVRSLRAPAPFPLDGLYEVAMNAAIRTGLLAESVSVERLLALLEEAAVARVHLDRAALSRVYVERLERSLAALTADPDDSLELGRLLQAVRLAGRLPLDLDLSAIQSDFADLWLAGDDALRARPEVRALALALRVRLG